MASHGVRTVTSTLSRAHRLASAAGGGTVIRPSRWRWAVDALAIVVTLSLVIGVLLLARNTFLSVKLWQAERHAGAMICPARVTLADFGACDAEDCRFRYYTAVSDLEVRNALIEQDKILREACGNVRRRIILKRSPSVPL